MGICIHKTTTLNNHKRLSPLEGEKGKETHTKKKKKERKGEGYLYQEVCVSQGVDVELNPQASNLYLRYGLN